MGCTIIIVIKKMPIIACGCVDNRLAPVGKIMIKAGMENKTAVNYI